MSVDKTAEAILAWSIDRNEYVRNPNDVEQSAYISDLQAMAKLWLMRDEIRTELRNLKDLACDEFGKDVSTAERLIEALEGNEFAEPQFEYEYFFESEPSDSIQIDGWLPVATERLTADPETLIAKGKLRKIGG